MSYEIVFTSTFKKDLKRAKKRGKNTNKLFEVIEKIALDEPLEASLKDHALTGNWVGTRECHIEPDWLLIYEKQGNQLALMLFRTGTHSDLFGK